MKRSNSWWYSYLCISGGKTRNCACDTCSDGSL